MRPPPWYRPGVAEVRNVDTGTVTIYTCPPRTAVIQAYAASRGDHNTWSAAARFGHLARRSMYGWRCGPCWCYDQRVHRWTRRLRRADLAHRGTPRIVRRHSSGNRA